VNVTAGGRRPPIAPLAWKSKTVRIVRVLFVAALLPLLASCTGDTSSIAPPEINPASAAEAAMAQYDVNGDKALSAEEIADSALSLEKWDGDKNKSLSQAEVEKRLALYAEHGVGMRSVYGYVMRGGQPLSGAQVTMVPEEFLGGAIQPATGTTGSDGSALLSVAPEFQPRPGVQVMQIGLYKVEVTHPQVPIKEVDPPAFELSPGEDIPPPTFQVK
jgi:hypothetical protein